MLLLLIDKQYVVEDRTFPYTLSDSIAEASQIKLTGDRIAQEKKTEFICACRPHTCGRNSVMNHSTGG